ncbi:MAG: PqqD family peptide modification chaperone [Actinomycetota bacterium]
MTVPLDQPIRRGPVLWRRSGDRVLIRRRGNDHLVVLGDTGVSMWLALAEPTTVGALAAELAEAHGALLDQVTVDVQAAVARLVADEVVIAS